jgi:hypothetical protein
MTNSKLGQLFNPSLQVPPGVEPKLREPLLIYQSVTNQLNFGVSNAENFQVKIVSNVTTFFKIVNI